MDTILKMTGISKQFAGVTVLDQVDFELKKGEVHVLIGENGAGKSTLMKILAGIHPPTAGEILLAGRDSGLSRVEIPDPRSALEMGISMVFQEFNLMENMSVAENIFIGREPVKRGMFDRKTLNRQAAEAMARVRLDMPPRTVVGKLSVAQKQCVEIAKSLTHDAKIIILDEPTSSLSEKEVRVLFNLIAELKAQGVSIVYISHRMEEIFEIGDRITVFRDGRYIDTVAVADTDVNQLVKMMIGREFDLDARTRPNSEKREVMLECRDVTARGFDARINLTAHAGEILGIFGLVGAGRTELARILFGIDPIGDGQLFKRGQRIFINNPDDAIKHKIGLIPEDRKLLGLIIRMNLRDNISLLKLREMPWILRSRAEESGMAAEYIDRLSIATSGQTQLVERLSGGNQQKVVISKWIAMDMDILILDEPTRGVDVGAKAEIYHIIRQLAQSGKCIIMISSDLPEILRVSHRVLVMHDGGVKLDAPVSELDQEIIMHRAISQD